MDDQKPYSFSNFLGITFLSNSEKDLLQGVTCSDDHVSRHVHLIAVSTMVASQKSDSLASILNDGVNICDSTPIFLLSQLHGKEVLHLRGADLMRQAFQSDQGQARHFLFGTTGEVLNQLEKRLIQMNTKVKIVGKIAPPFSDTSQVSEEHLDQIMDSKANVIWIGLGSPKQDIVAFEINRRLGVTAIAVGAAFDFISGSKKEIHHRLRYSGFEWTFRLITEPRRLWKRYLKDNFFFIIVYLNYLVRIFRLKSK